MNSQKYIFNSTYKSTNKKLVEIKNLGFDCFYCKVSLYCKIEMYNENPKIQKYYKYNSNAVCKNCFLALNGEFPLFHRKLSKEKYNFYLNLEKIGSVDI